VLARGTNTEADGRELIEPALADGARDNVTAVVSRALTA
jgi:serine/threonine protein phosphatase PrpC